MKFSSCLSSLLLLSAFACGDDSTRDSNSDFVGPGEAGETAAEAGESGEGNQEADGAEAETAEGETAEGETAEGETGPLECADMEDEASCADFGGCLALIGSKIADKGPDAPCLEMAEFVGCIGDPGGCDAAITYGCKNANNVFEFPDGCLPDGWDVCEPDAVPTGACP